MSGLTPWLKISTKLDGSTILKTEVSSFVKQETFLAYLSCCRSGINSRHCRRKARKANCDPANKSTASFSGTTIDATGSQTVRQPLSIQKLNQIDIAPLQPKFSSLVCQIVIAPVKPKPCSLHKLSIMPQSHISTQPSKPGNVPHLKLPFI